MGLQQVGESFFVRRNPGRKRQGKRSVERRAVYSCGCGQNVVCRVGDVKRGFTTSCGCLNRAVAAKRWRTHGKTGTPEHGVWKGMRQRCNDPNHIQYKDYGGRGITVCSRWDEFELFLQDMGPRPSANHDIDRIDNDAGYGPDNCRWVTHQENCRNKRTNVVLAAHGKRQTLAAWADDLGLSQTTLQARLSRGMSVPEALVSQRFKTGPKT